MNYPKLQAVLDKAEQHIESRWRALKGYHAGSAVSFLRWECRGDRMFVYFIRHFGEEADNLPLLCFTIENEEEAKRFLELGMADDALKMKFTKKGSLCASSS